MSTTDGVVADASATVPVLTVEFVTTEIVQPVLGAPGIGPNDDFFDYDATSLHMVQIVARVYEMFGIELPLPELFDEPTVTGLIWLIKNELGQE
jgi:acyl carrier protein